MHSILKYAGPVEKYPFPHIAIENAHDQYAELAKIFPKIKYGNANTVRSYIEADRAGSGWREFHRLHTSSAFAHEMCDKFGINRFRPDKLVCQVAINSPVTVQSTVKGPHLDHARKLWQGLWYFPVDCDDAGGDFLMYDCPTPALVNLPKYKRAVTNPGEPAKRIPYRPNMFICYLNSIAAVHGVSERKVTPLLRRYVNFSIILSVRNK